MARLGERGLTYDTWHYHYQNRDFLELARAVPGTTMILDHFGTPLGVGPYESQREQIFQQWTTDIADIAACENVVAKIGGLAMPDNGFGWHTAERPPTSDEFVEAQGRYYLHTIEQFGPERCMFESNFPVDRYSLSYRTVWNAFKKLIADFRSKVDKLYIVEESDPFMEEAWNPRPYSKAFAEPMLNIALPRLAWSLSKTGSPIPAGTPLIVQLMDPPRVSPASAVLSIISIIFASNSGSSAEFSAPTEETTAFISMPFSLRNSFATEPATTLAMVSRPEALPPPVEKGMPYFRS